MFGHEEANCKKKGGTRMEWRGVHKATTKENNMMQGTKQQEGLALLEDITPVPRRASAKKTMQVLNEANTRLDNPFQALDNAENMLLRPRDRRGGHLMDGIVSWNIRGLNWPNKQEDVHSFLHNNKFYITFVYGINQEQQRQPIWGDLMALSHQMTEAWCIIGDFNAMLYKEDRQGAI
ncbi:hypothetical protein Cgig2_023656 [Carnegiea gigantea]|uniref:Endonuclease/exonuclease/phosphatase domain-containing protein n=1 Tax=Carnegiea gigantea TaxID=171969 RepID=A0A9Q1JII1_9CARY|nr:hypothetical protein Cgig2_023656 [Carnegiea gigantea]